MALYDPEVINEVRMYLSDTTEPYQFSDAEITAVLDAFGGDTRLTAGSLWRSLAARYHKLSDITEAGSSRKNSQVFDHALKMAAIFDPGNDGEDNVLAPSTTRSIVRP